jgi:transposase
MSFKIYVGIDVSKLSLDVFIREKQAHKQFKNDSKGFALLIQWMGKQIQEPIKSILFCFEHTGLYSLPLALFFEEKQIHYSMIPALEIKRSLGVTRGKSDFIDSKRIAEFAYRFKDKVSVTKLPTEAITKVHSLLTLRDRLSRSLGSYVCSKNEFARALGNEYLPELLSSYDKMILAIKTEIKQLEKSIKTIINENTELRTSLELVTSVKGIGFIIASYLIVYTHNFTRFDNWRKFACYSGIAPFDYQSGTSVRGKTQVSSIANMQVKRLLHLGAICAIHTDIELRDYYQRRLSEGKTRMTVINVIRNKLIARIFAVVKRGTPFVDIKKYIAQ